MKKLENKVALVTSCTKGIGLACAKILAENGAFVWLAARNEKSAEQVAQEITQAGGQCKFVYFNAQEPETCTNMVEQAALKSGRFDILVNNYGGTDVRLDRDLVTGDTETFFRVLNQNIQTVYLPCKAAVPHMIRSGGGSIVNISSIGGSIPDLSRMGYSVSKAAVNSLTQNIALQFAHNGVRCNAVQPGLTATEAALKNMPEEFRISFLRHVPLGRMGQPEDIARAVLYYASDDSGYVTGMLHPVAGGYGLGTPQYGDFMEN